jgi:hypothetical protein
MPSPRPADTNWDRVAPRPFKIAVPESSLDDLKARLARVRWPDEISGEPWQFGTDLAYLKSLCAYWKDRTTGACRKRRSTCSSSSRYRSAGVSFITSASTAKAPTRARCS